MSFGKTIAKVKAATAQTAEQNKAGVLIPLIDEYLESLNGVHDGREPGFHCSSMYSLCPRALALSKRWPKPDHPMMYVPEPGEKPDFVTARKRIDPGLRRIFDTGHLYHFLLQDKYLAKAQLLYGHWECRRCARATDRAGFYPPKDMPCRHCGMVDAWKYCEPPILITGKGIRIVGHSDGVFVIRGTKYVIEIKSISTFKFQKLEKPQADHLNQIQLYMDALRIDRGVVLYINKDNQQLKEYLVFQEAGARETAINRALKWMEIQRGSKEIPERICGSPTDIPAEYCPYKEECFNDFKMRALLAKEKAAGE